MDILLGLGGAVMSTQEYMKKVVEDVSEDEDFKSGSWVRATDYVNANGGTASGCLGDIKNFLNNGKLDQVVAIVKSCSRMYIIVSESAQDRDVGLEGSGFRNFAKKESMRKAFQDMMHGLGEVNPTYAYYNGSCTSKDNKDPSWEYKVQDKDELRKHLQALKLLEDFISVVFCNLIGTFVR
ncbi:hypothetical protein Tco_1548521 [Tanacetum coccineum]